MDAVLLLIMAASGLSAVSSQVRRQYHFIQQEKTMPEAQRYCRAKYTDLATVDNMEDMNILRDVAKKSKGVYIGLYGDVNSWKWSDGSTSSFRYWYDDQPNGGACVVATIRRDGKWFDDSCDHKLPFVCYSPLTTRQVIKVRLVGKDSSLDPNDPAVMEQMLKEFKQRLEDKGVKGDVKLSWRKQSDGKVFHKEEEEEEAKKKKKTRSKKDEI